jgi:hypothetical protein
LENKIVRCKIETVTEKGFFVKVCGLFAFYFIQRRYGILLQKKSYLCPAFLLTKDMFRELFNTAVLLILKPSEAWMKLKNEQEKDNEKFLSRFVYPFIGLMAFTAFIGIFLSRKNFDIQVALKSSILSLTSSLGGFFLASYILNDVWNRYFGRKKDFNLCQRFVGYSSVMMFVLNIFLNLLPDFFYLKICLLYTLYIVWEGTFPYMEVNKTEQLKFSITATALVILLPVLIEVMLRMFMPGLRI